MEIFSMHYSLQSIPFALSGTWDIMMQPAVTKRFYCSTGNY